MKTRFVRINGQAALRANLRRCLRDSPLTQADALRRAAVPPHRLYAFFRGDGWLDPDDLERLAHALGANAEDLAAGSIFRHERTRYTAFDRPPTPAEHDTVRARKQAEPQQPAKSLTARALCCRCGALRSTTPPTAIECTATDGTDAPATRRLPCDSCDDTTTHAVLHAVEAGRDYAETHMTPLLSSSEWTSRRDGLVERIRGFNVCVEYRSLERHRESRRARDRRDDMVIRYEFDSSKSQWRIEVDPIVAARIQYEALDELWERISRDDFDEYDFDPRKGAASLITNSGWSSVVDDLVDDIRTALPLERRRMAASIRDQVDPAGEISETGEVSR